MVPDHGCCVVLKKWTLIIIPIQCTRLSSCHIMGKRIHTCEFEGCSASFRRLDRLKGHLRLHTNERPYICTYDDCDKSYFHLHHLKRHEDTHETRLKCTEANCDKFFISKSTLKKHIDIVHQKKKPKTYKCSYCNEDFNKHSWLARHEYRHTNIKPYQCPKENCGKRFLVPSKLKKHLKVHEGYPCTKPNCDEIFSTWSLYVKHQKVAHPKIHKCEFCEKQFASSYNLKIHSEGHRLDRTVFLCPKENCNKFYFLKKTLNFHIRSYHENHPFKCTANNCHKAFTTQTALDAHLPWHDPNKRLRKRKKKKKSKPSFAAVLAGCVKRKCDEAKKPEHELENSAITEAKDKECSEVHEKCQDDISKSDGTEKVYTDIQTLLSMIAKRSSINNKSTSMKNFISLKV